MGYDPISVQDLGTPTNQLNNHANLKLNTCNHGNVRSLITVT